MASPISRPRFISSKLPKKALDDGWTHYGPAACLPELREAVADYVGRTRRTAVHPDRVCIVPGGKPILFFSMLAVLEKGDEVLYPNPGFPIYELMIRFAGATPVPMRLREDRDFAIDPEALADRITARTRMLILNSPQNPTGAVVNANMVSDYAALLRGRDVVVLSDEIYSRIWFDKQPMSIAGCTEMAEKTILLDGFSKTYAMTGWRIGYGVLPRKLAAAVNRLMVNSNSCTAAFTQKAALAALTGPQDDVDKMVTEFRRRRDMFCEGLNSIPGFSCSYPSGAFYTFVNIERTCIASQHLADALLERAGVACLSGTAFGNYGEGYLRFNIAASQDSLMQAIERMRAFFGGGAQEPAATS